MNLKKCPFCGGEGELTFSGNKWYDDHWKGFITVKCIRCGASVKGAFYEGPSIKNVQLYETIGGYKAMQNWNERVLND